MKTLAVLLVVLACLSGCSAKITQAPAGAYLDTSELTDAQRAIVLRAADEWYVATAGAVDVAAGTTFVVPVHAGVAVQHADGATVFHDDGTVDITIDFDKIAASPEPDSAPFVATHELGHLFGLSHLEGTLMSAHTVQAPCIDETTLARVCANYACTIETHATCN